MKAAKTVVRELRRTQVSLGHGDLWGFERNLSALTEQVDDLQKTVDGLRSLYDLDPKAYLESGAYAAELCEAATTAGLIITEEDDQLLCHPSIIRIRPKDVSIEIDRKREHRLRPSTVIAVLSARQQRDSRFNPETFLNSIRNAYDLIVARQGRRPDSVVRLVDIWKTLTLLPAHSREYTKQAFARDLYLLDKSGTSTTRKSSRRLRWCASSGTRSTGILSVVTPEGRQQQYWGISFSPSE